MNQALVAYGLGIICLFSLSLNGMNLPGSPSKKPAKIMSSAAYGADSSQTSSTAEGEPELTAEDLAALDKAESGPVSPKKPGPVGYKRTFAASPKKYPVSPKKQRELPPVQVFNTFPQMHFSPGIKDVLLKLIHDEQESIQAAVYRFTLYDVAQAWANVHVTKKLTGKLILDNGFQDDFCAALRLLQKNGISVCSLKAQQGQFETMHHKIFLFYKNIANKKLVVSGSFNVTGAAHARNFENITITEDSAVFASCEKEFMRMQRNVRVLAEKNLMCTATNKSEIGRALNQIPAEEPN